MKLAADHPVLEAPPERLLSTMNRDGSRHWIHPRLSKGRYYYRRMALACSLIAIFAALPFVFIGGKPAILLDLANRKFTFFGTTFLPTDSFLLLTLTLGLFLGIFLFTALWGRLWCGWACPQTVYMEFVFRPLDRWVRSRVLKYALLTLISLAMAHVFVAYFSGSDFAAPFDHPIRTTAVLIVAGLILFDYGYFREQTCTIACPYGRFQSVLLDRRSLIVGYDPARGEPRGKGSGRSGLGDCIDCGACVATCPTGIDIRQGLQMECVNCAQCIDACDRIMGCLGKPRGLIRYVSQHELEKSPERPFRYRVLVYSLLMLVVATGFTWALLGKRDAEVSILRNDSSPWRMMGNDDVASLFRIRIRNATDASQEYTISITGNDEARLVCPSNPMRIDGLKQETATVFVVLPRNAASREVTMTVTDGKDFRYSKKLQLSGPTR